jgi:N-acetylmuramic acid 6-phosphate etherase
MTSTTGDFKCRAQEFLSVSSQFRLGELPTEQSHPLTTNLSALAQNDPANALKTLHEIDCLAIDHLRENLPEIVDLAKRVGATLNLRHSVYLCGCGSTGRLSLACETLFRSMHRHDGLRNRVIGFMAGGDVALVRSVENFEDHPEYGARHLDDLEFVDGDLFIGCTEGGETPFVIGATLRAAEISSNAPYFLYCNPDDLLCSVAERSAEVLHDPRIKKVNCTVGPMALAGSTRMQASTVLMIAVGYALLCHADPHAIHDAVDVLLARWNDLDPSFLEEFIVKESSYYRQGDYLLYEADRDFAVTILTDTTERAPTFNLRPFECSQDSAAAPSLCYLYLPDAPDSAHAWELILGRRPRTSSVKLLAGDAPHQRYLQYDFSAQLLRRRSAAIAPARHYCFSIKHDADAIAFDLDGSQHRLPANGLPLFSMHIILKMLLNMHSTLVMGRLGRYDGNIMTWVKPSNNKLIDRTIRYVDLLLKRQGISVPYDQIALVCFEIMKKGAEDQSIVHDAVKSLQTMGDGKQQDYAV